MRTFLYQNEPTPLRDVVVAARRIVVVRYDAARGGSTGCQSIGREAEPRREK
jgi:hypothetical protein